MRFLHTSDWHLGRSLHQQDLHEYQADFLSQIESTVINEDVDVVLVAGDVFDRAVPPVESIALFSDTLNRLADQCVVVVTSGNHDSAIRLGYGAKLFRPGIHIHTETDSVGAGIEISSDDVTVRIYPIPYLVPDHAREVLKVSDEPLPRSHQAVLQAATDRIRGDLAALPTAPDATVVIAHAFVTSAKGNERGLTSDSERDISVGGVDVATSDVFSGFDYVALGHLHGQQTVAGPSGTTIRYSGSPLRYSFSETHHSKSVTLFDIDGAGVCGVRSVSVTQPREMAALSGTLAEVLVDENVEEFNDAWLQVVVTDAARPPDLVATIKEMFPHALSISHRPNDGSPIASDQEAELATLTPVQISERFVEEVVNRSATSIEIDILRQVYEVARTSVES